MDCPHFEAGRCSSCSEIRTPYAQQLQDKQAAAQRALAGNGDFEWLAPVASAQRAFRNRAKMVVSGSASQPILGIINALGEAVDLTDCLLYSPSLQQALRRIAQFIIAAALPPYELTTRRGELKYLLLTESASGELMLRLVLRSRACEARIRKHLPVLLTGIPALRVVSLNLLPEHKAVLEGEQEIILTPATTLSMPLDVLTLTLAPQSFFQTNTELAAKLYARAAAWVDVINPVSLWDLYCGVGGFALACAAPGRDVVGVEISEQALECARLGAVAMGLASVRFVALDVAQFSNSGELAPECIVVNPPRRGLGATVCDFIAGLPTRWLIYSSCNVVSMAADLAQLKGFKLRQAQVFDLFPHTQHFEVLALLQRQD